jgi:hypothetical protein
MPAALARDGKSGIGERRSLLFHQALGDGLVEELAIVVEELQETQPHAQERMLFIGVQNVGPGYLGVDQERQTTGDFDDRPDPLFRTEGESFEMRLVVIHVSPVHADISGYPVDGIIFGQDAHGPSDLDSWVKALIGTHSSVPDVRRGGRGAVLRNHPATEERIASTIPFTNRAKVQTRSLRKRLV